MHKTWKIQPRPSSKSLAMLGKYSQSHIVSSLLINRGVHTEDEADYFFNPSLQNLYDPFQLKDMKKAVDRIEKAIQENEKILFYGDYDVDGTTSVAMIWLFFQQQLGYRNIGYYIPDRYTEGYGVSSLGIERAAENGYKLIISLDCGIKSADKIMMAQSKGIDFIICDHHLPDDTIPDAVAILNPKQPDCTYPYKELSGCGVAFKMLQAIALNKNISSESVLSYLDLVAVSTCCDIVPIRDENRILVHFGLKKLNTSPSAGLASIIKTTQLDHHFTVEDVVFIIGPRINAAGRIKHGSGAVDLLISDKSDPDIEALTNQLNQHNTTRKELDKQTTKEALQIIAANAEWYENASSTVLFHPEWHKGVIGIVASRVIETHYKPTIILTESNGKATGSARSVREFDIHAAISRCAHLLDNYGGHIHAAGLTMPVENVEAFRQAFDKVVRETWPPFIRKPVVNIDEEILLEDINESFFNLLQQFAPFGPENMDPVFLTRNLHASRWTKIVGENHLKLYVTQGKKQTPSFAGIAFKQGNHLERIQKGDAFHLVYGLRINEWNGKKSIELDVKDIRYDDLSEIQSA